MKKHNNRITVLTILVAASMLLGSCDKVRKEVVQTYENGKPMLVYLVKGKKDNPTRQQVLEAIRAFNDARDWEQAGPSWSLRARRWRPAR